jgi:hypothetical protein
MVSTHPNQEVAKKKEKNGLYVEERKTEERDI